jgi:spermidine/putrescine-binding protein
MRKDETEFRILAPKCISRRKLFQLAGVAAGSAMAGRLGIQSASAQSRHLNYFTWETFSREIFQKDAQERLGISIKPTLYASADEMVAKLRAGGGRLYDMCVPVHSHVKIAAQVGVIEPLDRSKLTNLGQVFTEFRDMPDWSVDGKTYGVPFVWGANALAFDRKVTGELDSVEALFDPKWKGKIGMRDSHEDSLAIAAFKLGIERPFGMDERELQECKKLLVAQKPLVRTYWKSIADARAGLGSGELAVSWAFLSLVAPLRAAGVDIGWVWPKEGAVGWTEAFTPVKGTRNLDLVTEYANYSIGPDYGQLLAEKTRYATSSSDAVKRLDPGLVKDLGIDPSRLKLLSFIKIPDNLNRYMEIWNEVKNA